MLQPNCYSRVVDILGKKHILIFALRRIIQGEELTYDYKFPFEDIKIPCTCGSRKCRKYLNWDCVYTAYPKQPTDDKEIRYVL